MRIEVLPYGIGTLLQTVLIDAGAATPGIVLESGASIVAGDVKRVGDKLASGNLTAEFAQFTSGSREPLPGETITNNSQTAVVIGTWLTSGSWGAGTAAGYIFLEQVSGVMAAGQIDIGAETDVATLSADPTPSIGAVMTGTTLLMGLTSTEMAQRQIRVEWADQDGPVFISDALYIRTSGSVSAFYESGTIAAELADYDVAVVGSPMTLEDGSITNAKFAAGALEEAAINADVFQAISDDVVVALTNVGLTAIQDSVNDAAATDSAFEVGTDQGSKILVGFLKFTSGALSGESRLVRWTGTTVTCLFPDTPPAGLEQAGPFSAAPADTVTFIFTHGR